MSHFSVLVIGPDVEEQLAPYHEFECTGVDDQYVKDVDITEKARAEYESDTTTRYCDPAGGSYSPYEDRFYREPTPEELKEIGPIAGTGGVKGFSFHSKNWGDGRGYRAKIHFLPEGWEEITMPTSEVKTFEEFVGDYYGYKVVREPARPDTDEEHKFGYAMIRQDGTVQVIDRTNEEKKWDWYQVGGRWTGFFKLKAHALCGALGKPGLQEMDPDYEPPTADRGDMCLKADIDIEGMRSESADKAAAEYQLFRQLTDPHPPIVLWDAMVEKHAKDYDAARKEYHEQPGVKVLAADRNALWFEPNRFACTLEEYIERARRGAVRTFAVVKDGKWFERGSMGWWGCVSDEKDEEAWSQQFSDLVDSLPDDTMLTIVDCHI